MIRIFFLTISLVFFLQSYSFSQSPARRPAPPLPPADGSPLSDLVRDLPQPPSRIGQVVGYGEGAEGTNIISTSVRYTQGDGDTHQVIIVVTYRDGSTRYYILNENGRISVSTNSVRDNRVSVAFVLPRVDGFPERVMERDGRNLTIHMGNGLDYRFSLLTGRMTEIVGGGCVSDVPPRNGRGVGFNIESFRGIVIDTPESNSESNVLSKTTVRFSPAIAPIVSASGDVDVRATEIPETLANWQRQGAIECASLAVRYRQQIRVRHRDSLSGLESTCRTSFSSLMTLRVQPDSCRFRTEGRGTDRNKVQCMCEPVFKTDINPATQELRSRPESDRLLSTLLVGACPNMQSAYANWQPRAGEQLSAVVAAEAAAAASDATTTAERAPGVSAQDAASQH